MSKPDNNSHITNHESRITNHVSRIPFIDFGGEGPLLHFAHANAYPPRCYRHFLALLTPHFHVVQSALRRRHQFESREYAFNHWRRKPVFQRWSDEALLDYVNSALIPDAQNGGFRLAYPREWEVCIYAHPPQWVWDVLPQIRQPTLGIRGAETDTIVLEAWQLWQEKQPQAKFVEMADVGHMLLLERPSAAAQIILDYLTAV